MRGYIEEGTTTTPFDLLIANQVTRYHLAAEALRRLPDRVRHSIGRTVNTDHTDAGADIDALADDYERRIMASREEILRTGTDPETIREWRWTG
ncbi:phosphoketolase [Tenggerimyces flavus]|nr:phosphoketolase [Tenggerimyces flavus]